MIRLAGIRKTHGDGTVALRGVDLDVEDGMLGVLGPNGAGKTTLLSIIVLALEPSSGTRRHGALDPARPADRGAIRASIGYLPQDFAPIGHLRGLQYLLHCARLRGSRLPARRLEARAMELLEAVDLTRAARRRCGGYSGGMKRRLGIAQALIHAPTLVVVDEPTAGLDPEERVRFRNLITAVADETAVLLSTHVVEDIEATCPRLAIIADGRKLFDGPPEELLAAVDGRLFEVAESAAAGSRPVARRLRKDGGLGHVVVADRAPAGGSPVEPTLEIAYSAFLARAGMTIESGGTAA